jgi:prepilin-type N-terminal cleavage/methylation domain-containing protein
MKIEPPARRHSEAGFSLIELLAVVAIIAIMATVALPNIGQFLRNYKLRGATQELVRQMDTARLKAITGNVNRGVSFVIVDANSYRWVREDAPGAPGYVAGEEFGPLQDLPLPIRFVAGNYQMVRFNRLGGACQPGVAPCAAAYAGALCPAAEGARCADAVPGNYISFDATTTAIVTVEDISRGTPGQRRRISIAPGGRVLPQQ